MYLLTDMTDIDKSTHALRSSYFPIEKAHHHAMRKQTRHLFIS